MNRRTLLRFGALAFAAPRSVVVPPYLTEWEQRQVIEESSHSYAPAPFCDHGVRLAHCDECWPAAMYSGLIPAEE